MVDPQLFFQLLVSGIVKGSQYALVATSFGIIFSTTQIFHLAHAAVFAFAAYGVVLIANSLGLPIWLAIPAGLVTAVLLGSAIELGVYRTMRRRSATKLGAFLASLGLSIVGANLLQVLFGPKNRSVARFSVHTFEIRNVTFTSYNIIAVVIGWLCIGALLIFLKRTQYGRAINAVRTNPAVAMAVGISIDRIYLLAIALGSLLVGVASVLFVVDNVAFPSMGLEPVLIGFIAVFLGGTDSLPGAAVGGFTLGLLTSLSGIWLSGTYAPVVIFGALFLILIFRPQGLLGKAAV
ncbi:MAG: branched-chain amino acid ABC transporter permease [Thermomicrobiales bacterium]